MKNKRIVTLFTAAISVCLFSLTAFAAGLVDIHKPVKIETTSVFDSVPMNNMHYELYKVADMDTNGYFSATPDFSAFASQLDLYSHEQILQLADAINAHVLKNSVPAFDSGYTDANGRLVFPASVQSMTAGLYLVADGHHIQDDILYETKPFLVYLPYFIGNTGYYSIQLSPKYSSVPVDDVYIQINVVKIWKDDGHENNRPKEITVTLYNGKTAYDTVNLGNSNSWRHTWKNLDKAGDWTVVENAVDGYTSKVQNDGTTYIVTNTYIQPQNTPIPLNTPTPPTSQTPQLPVTGQNWMPVMALFAAGLVLVIVGIIRRRTGDYEE